MRVKINDKEVTQEKSDAVLTVLEEHDRYQADIAILEKNIKDLRFKVSVCEARLIEDLSDSEIEEVGGQVNIKVYSMTGDLKDDRTLTMKEEVKPKKIGVTQIRNMLADLLQQEMLEIDTDAIFTWLEENGYIAPFEREKAIEKITSLELLEILTKSVEQTGTTKRKLRNALS